MLSRFAPNDIVPLRQLFIICFPASIFCIQQWYSTPGSCYMCKQCSIGLYFEQYGG